MTQKHVLLVGGPGSELDKLDRLGVRFSMMQIPERVAARQYTSAAHYAVLDYRDLDEVLAVARAWHCVDPFDAVASFTEYGLYPASRVARELGIAGDNLTAVELTRDKVRTRELLDRHGLSPVRHRLCAGLEDARAFLRELGGGPVVLKPRDGGLSEGVYLAASEEELTERWEWSRRATDGPLLVEEFLTGPEFSVESVSVGGRHEIAAITEKVTTELPRFVETGHQVPARLDEASRTAVEELVRRFLTLIEQRDGPVHTELRLTAAGPRLIEAQTRVGGDQIWELCELVSGVDLMAETFSALLGLPRPPRTPVAGAAAIRFFSYENVRILGVDGLDEARTAPGVLRLRCTLEPGQELGALTSSTARQGYVLCTGADTAGAMAAAERAHDLVKVVTQPL
ncbi:phosphoribosylglycinamide synthetase [Streptomyces viridochromogenes DSM 40736]|uniref:Phosphoribosylglycinamide synthetase n=1 Tax=Streptomyces viridochromogenes (strain DSM 40736 / JCM 4977 / BCRC 1201 / Tue 494) TaxID=591159 RepID=D9X4W6_STRVT|nr:ATP-grasp domain-containing protein [Streptomyces viridochromogenes]EFL31704.1 phosphoribosylglycinamide synthetase [Streptomyces viridochromogenes DSM 40736]